MERARADAVRLLAVAVVAASVLGAVACSSDGEDTAGGERRSTTTAATSGPTTAGDGGTGGGAATSAGSGGSGSGGSDGSVPTPTTAPADPNAPKLVGGTLGALRVGMTTAEAAATGLLEGRFAPGCDLADPRPEVAALRAPLVGQVTAVGGVVTAISVSSGTTTAEGLRPGMTRDTVEAALRAAGTPYTFDDSQEQSLGILVLRTSGPGRPVELAIDPADDAVSTMATPALQFCE